MEKGTESADSLSLHKADSDDIPDLVRLRRLMFQEMGFTSVAELDRSDRAAAEYFNRAIPAGDFHGWLVRLPKGRAVACGGAVIDQHPPGPSNLTGRTGYIMNMSTEPSFRRRGIARKILVEILNWFTGQGIEIVALHATAPGRPLYEEHGFRDSNEMHRTPDGRYER